MSIVFPTPEIDPMLPDGYYGLTLTGLPGHPKTAVALGGEDMVTGKWWQVPIEPDPEHPVDSLQILVPDTVPLTRVLSADEFLDFAEVYRRYAILGESQPFRFWRAKTAAGISPFALAAATN